jgi:hypothetical protein
MCFVWIAEQHRLFPYTALTDFFCNWDGMCLLCGTDWVFKCNSGYLNRTSTFCPHSAFMCFVWISEQTGIISLHSINWLVFITERWSVYCAVRTESWNVFQVTFLLHSNNGLLVKIIRDQTKLEKKMLLHVRIKFKNVIAQNRKIKKKECRCITVRIHRAKVGYVPAVRTSCKLVFIYTCFNYQLNAQFLYSIIIYVLHYNPLKVFKQVYTMMHVKKNQIMICICC